jgi:hypothetical protein
MVVMTGLPLSAKRLAEMGRQGFSKDLGGLAVDRRRRLTAAKAVDTAYTMEDLKQDFATLDELRAR